MQAALPKDSRQACCVHSFPVQRCSIPYKVLLGSLKKSKCHSGEPAGTSASDRPGFVLLQAIAWFSEPQFPYCAEVYHREYEVRTWRKHLSIIICVLCIVSGC